MARMVQKHFAMFAAGMVAVLIPLEAAAAANGDKLEWATPYLFEMLVAGLIAGALLLIDLTSWSLLTSRR